MIYIKIRLILLKIKTIIVTITIIHMYIYIKILIKYVQWGRGRQVCRSARRSATCRYRTVAGYIPTFGGLIHHCYTHESNLNCTHKHPSPLVSVHGCDCSWFTIMEMWIQKKTSAPRKPQLQLKPLSFSHVPHSTKHLPSKSLVSPSCVTCVVNRSLLPVKAFSFFQSSEWLKTRQHCWWYSYQSATNRKLWGDDSTNRWLQYAIRMCYPLVNLYITMENHHS